MEQLGSYKPLREIGRGAMSTVYEALDTRSGHTVALKVLETPYRLAAPEHAARIARLEREARVIARLSHPNIVAIYDVGRENDRHFIVMERLDGSTLRERLDDAPFSLLEAAHILRQVADALDAVHRQGIVHRDIKPSNVMLLPDRSAKLLDFGVARHSEEVTLTEAGHLVGSPAYLSPEQARGEMGTPASDLWALGVLLYEMLAGRPPFVGGTIPAVLYQVIHEEPAPLPGVSSRIQKILRRALEKNPGKRYGSASEMADALHASLTTPAKPRPTPTGVIALLTTALLGAGLLTLRQEGMPSRLIAPQPAASRTADLPRLTPPEPAFPANRTPAPSAPRSMTPKPSPRQTRPPRTQQTRPPRTPAAKPQEDARPKAPVAAGPERRQADAPREKRQPPPDARPRKPARVAASPPPVSPPRSPARETSAPPPRSARRENSLPLGETDIRGTWRGNIWKDTATLVITERRGNAFRGRVTVQTDRGTARLAVAGEVSPDTARITLWPAGTLPGSELRDWDMGRESGHILEPNLMGGLGRAGNRVFTWSFSR